MMRLQSKINGINAAMDKVSEEFAVAAQAEWKNNFRVWVTRYNRARNLPYSYQVDPEDIDRLRDSNTPTEKVLNHIAVQVADYLTLSPDFISKLFFGEVNHYLNKDRLFFELLIARAGEIRLAGGEYENLINDMVYYYFNGIDGLRDLSERGGSMSMTLKQARLMAGMLTHLSKLIAKDMRGIDTGLDCDLDATVQETEGLCHTLDREIGIASGRVVQIHRGMGR